MTNKRQAILWMIYACAMTSLMITLVRFLSFHYDTFQVVFFRNIFALFFCIPWIIRSGTSWYDLNHVKTSKLKIHLYRAIMATFAMTIYFYAVTVIPLTIATSLTFIAPLITALLAVVLLGERYGIRRWSALFIGFLGTIVVLRPGSDVFDSNALLVLLAASLWSTSSIFIKNASKTDNPQQIAFYMVLLMTPMSIPLAITVWKPITMEMLPYLFALGLMANLFQVALSRAISLTEVTVTLPYDFTRLIFMSIFAYIFFGEILDKWTVVGAAIIMVSAVYASYRDSLKKRDINLS